MEDEKRSSSDADLGVILFWAERSMGGWILNLVPKAGLEPARISPHAPQTCASTNSATWAGDFKEAGCYFFAGAVGAAGRLLMTEERGCA